MKEISGVLRDAYEAGAKIRNLGLGITVKLL